MTWCGRSDRRLNTRVDEPLDGSACGALVIVPSVGREFVVAFRTVRALAVQAASAGFIVFSPDLSGNGDSPPATADDLVSTWREDVLGVVGEVREHLGGKLPVHIVGLRIGASLVATLPSLPGEARVAWEPVSGKAFLRRATAVRRLTMPEPMVEDGVEMPGFHLSTAQAKSLSSLAAPTADHRVTVAVEGDRDAAARIASVSPHHARIPHASVERIVASLPSGPRVSMPEFTPTPDVTLSADGAGCEVIERHVQVGAHALPGIITYPVDPHAGPALLFTAMGAELRCGPGSLWTTAARELAARGVICLRVDRRLLGDALDPSVASEPRPYTRECIEDLVESVDWLQTHTGRPVVGVGVCSGAWALLNAGRFIRLQSIIAVNNIDWDPDPDSYDEAFYEQAFRFDSVMSDSAVSAAEADREGGSSAWVGLDAVRRYRALRHRLGVRFPGARAWLRRERVGTPIGLLIDPVHPQTKIRLLLGQKESSRLRMLHGEADVVRAQRRGRAISVESRAGFDHSMLTERARRDLFQDLIQLVM